MGAAHKGLTPDDPRAGEEYMSGPYALQLGCNGYIKTLSEITDKTFVDSLPQRTTANGQLAVKVFPHNIWERLLLSGVSAEIWMEPGVTSKTIKQNTASSYDANVN